MALGFTAEERAVARRRGKRNDHHCFLPAFVRKVMAALFSLSQNPGAV
jgi:hypothetical protein